MGGDGGSIPSRIDMVKVKGYGSAQRSSQGAMGFQPNGMRRLAEETVDTRERRKLRMTTCALTEEPLVKPIIFCRRGFLFNKEDIVKRLLDKSLPDIFEHITSLKDVLDANFSLAGGVAVCPLTGKDLTDGVTKSVVMWPCGCALSEKGLEQSKKRSADIQRCVSCSKPVDLQIKLFPDDPAEVDRQKQIAMDMRAKHKSVIAAASSSSEGTIMSSKRFKVEAKELVKSDVMAKILHDSKTKVDKVDAFGRAYASKGVGI